MQTAAGLAGTCPAAGTAGAEPAAGNCSETGTTAGANSGKCRYDRTCKHQSKGS